LKKLFILGNNFEIKIEISKDKRKVGHQ